MFYILRDALCSGANSLSVHAFMTRVSLWSSVMGHHVAW